MNYSAWPLIRILHYTLCCHTQWWINIDWLLPQHAWDSYAQFIFINLLPGTRTGGLVEEKRLKSVDSIHKSEDFDV